MYKGFYEEEYSGIPDSTDYDILTQSSKELFCRIEILSSDYRMIQQINGHVTGCSYSEDSTSDIRKTATIDLIADSSVGFGPDKSIWFDKNVRIKIGFLHVPTNTIRWYVIGTFIFDAVNPNYDPSTNALSVSCTDLCARMDGSHGGTIAAKEITIQANSKINEVIKSIVSECPFIQESKIIVNKVAMSDDDGNIYYDYPLIPYDLEFQTGTTWLDVLVAIRDLYSGYEFFFDDTTFVYQPIESEEYSPVILSKDHMSQIMISEGGSINLNEIKNVSIVWGTCYDVDHFSIDTSATLYQDRIVYTMVVDSISELADGTYFGFTCPLPSSLPIYILLKTSNDVWLTSKENGYDDDGNPVYEPSEIPLMKYNGANAVSVDSLEEEKSYIIQFKNDKFLLMGQHQISAAAKLVSSEPTNADIEQDKLKYPVNVISYIVDPNSNLTVDKIGERVQVLSGSDYDSIYSDELAVERAKYENWKKTDLLDTISIPCIDAPFLHVNHKIEFMRATESVAYVYDVVSKTGDVINGTMDIEIKRHKGEYPWTK